MHFHQYRGWKYDHDLKCYVDGYYTKTLQIWYGFCTKCGKPKRKKLRR